MRCIARDGTTADERVGSQHECLQTLRELGLVQGIRPTVTEQEDFIYLVTSWVEGICLNESSVPITIAMLVALIDEVVRLHAAGFVHRDIKPTNILLGTDGKSVRLIDFECAGKIGGLEIAAGTTLGYRPKEFSDANIGAHESFDVYSLGAVILQVLTGIDPAHGVISRKVVYGALILNGYGTLQELVWTALSDIPAHRPSLTDLRNALTKVSEKGICAVPALKMRWHGKILLRLVQRCTQHICDYLEEGPNVTKASKRAFHPCGSADDISLNTGRAGALLGLCRVKELSDAAGVRSEALHCAVADLLKVDWSKKPKGLFVGQAGAALAISEAGQLLPDTQVCGHVQTLMSSCLEAANDPDLFFGLAGIVLAASLISREACADYMLSAVTPLATQLLSKACKHRELVCWVPSGELDGSQVPKTSVSHGVAGIALALGLYEHVRRAQDITKNISSVPEYALFALYAHGRTDSLKDRSSDTHASSGLAATVLGNAESTPNSIWCRGVSGYLWALLRARCFIKNTDHFDVVARWCIDLVLAERVAGSPTLCHGAAGSLDLFLDILATDFDYRTNELTARADAFARLLANNAQRDESGIVRWPSESRDWHCYGIWVGMTGALYSLTRWMAFREGRNGWKKLLFGIS